MDRASIKQVERSSGEAWIDAIESLLNAQKDFYSNGLRWWQRPLYANSTRGLRTALAGTGTTALIESRLPLVIAEPVPERIRSSQH